MKKFKVVASYVTYCTAEIEAEDMDEAFAIAKSMDGGSFDADEHSGSDWNIEQVEEIDHE
jgi:hypothetical protein